MRQALELALEALQVATTPLAKDRQEVLQAITAIKEALAQPEQEPVAIVHRNEYNEYRLEPHDNFDIKSIPFNIDVPLFKSPQRTWVGLTDEEELQLAGIMDKSRHWLVAAVEAKLKDKNL